MHHAWLVFGGGHKSRIDGVSHPCSHGTTNFKIARSDYISTLVKSNGNVIQPLPQIRKVSNNGKNSHEFRAYGDSEF